MYCIPVRSEVQQNTRDVQQLGGLCHILLILGHKPHSALRTVGYFYGMILTS